MATHGRGLICLCLTEERCDELGLRPMARPQRDAATGPRSRSRSRRARASRPASPPPTARTRSRSRSTRRAAPTTSSSPATSSRCAPAPAACSQRAGQTEAAVDLARLAGLNPAGVICEVMNDDGTMARVPDLIPYCERHGLKMVTVADLIEYRRRTRSSSSASTRSGCRPSTASSRPSRSARRSPASTTSRSCRATSTARRTCSSASTPSASPATSSTRSAATAASSSSSRSSGSPREERGVLLYMAQEGRGIGLLNKLKAYELQEQGLDTVEANLELGFPADAREYGIGTQILADLGLTTIRLLTNNPRKIAGIEAYGLKVVEQVPIEMSRRTPRTAATSTTKRDKLGHRLHHQGSEVRAGGRVSASEFGRASAG